MNIDDLESKKRGEELSLIKKSNSVFDDFLRELLNFFEKNSNKNEDISDKNRNTSILEEDKIYVVSNIEDNSINVVDIENGNEVKINVLTSDENMLNSSNDYYMDRLDFLNLNLTDNVVAKNNKLCINFDKIEIKNELAWCLLEDLYCEEMETEGQQYKVVEITDNKIFLTNADDSGGYFSIYKELYPDFEVGDIVEKNNKKYYRILEEN